MHLNRQYNCRSLRCCWSIACRRCSNYIFILDLTPGFIGLDKENCATRRETFKFGDLVRLILEILRYLSKVLSKSTRSQWAKPMSSSPFLQAVKLECVQSTRHRYMVLVSTQGRQDTEECVLLGIDIMEQTTIGLLLPIWGDTSIRLDGDGWVHQDWWNEYGSLIKKEKNV